MLRPVTKRKQPTRYMKYLRGVPKTIPEGLILVHNVTWPGPGTPMGLNGFRIFLAEPASESFVPCSCAYTELPHFRTRSRSL
jgi:hypothetical protein